MPVLKKNCSTIIESKLKTTCDFVLEKNIPIHYMKMHFLKHVCISNYVSLKLKMFTIWMKKVKILHLWALYYNKIFLINLFTKWSTNINMLTDTTLTTIIIHVSVINEIKSYEYYKLKTIVIHILFHLYIGLL